MLAPEPVGSEELLRAHERPDVKKLFPCRRRRRGVAEYPRHSARSLTPTLGQWIDQAFAFLEGPARFGLLEATVGTFGGPYAIYANMIVCWRLNGV